VTDGDLRAPLVDVRETAREPALDHRYARRGELGCRGCPPAHQLALQVARAGREDPIAWLTTHVVSKSCESLARELDGVRSDGNAKALVGPLMPVDELANRLILRLRGRADDPTVVGQRKQDGRTMACAMRRQRAQPLLGHEIEQGRGGDQLSADVEILIVDASLKVGASCRHATVERRAAELGRYALEETGVVVDQEPLLISWKMLGKVAKIRAGAGAEVEHAERTILGQRRRKRSGQRERTGRAVGWLA
jgi:hypothetical protein